ncbi:MAG: response regulator, partial [Planctomycetaceae bacterium]|nr:response regulator [Planctomycetaceae bacterium]
MSAITRSEYGVILVIDDNPTNIKVAIDALKAYGFDTLVARNGTVGLQRAAFSLPDLILLDVMMP